MNNPIRCTTHFHACDCREYEFEMLQKENEELKKKFKDEEDCWLISMESRDEKITELQKENINIRSDFKECLLSLRLLLKTFGGFSGRDGCLEAIDLTAHKYGITLSETPKSSKEGV